MNAAVKVLIGIILLIIGLGLFASDIRSPGFLGIQWLNNFVVVLTGIIPIVLILLGLFVVWLEVDELKTQKELARETKKKRKE